MPLAGEFFDDALSAKTCDRYSLRLLVCDSCGLMQIGEGPPITRVFHDKYNYSTGEIPPLVSHFREYADFIRKQSLPSERVLEFGCNDGTLLEFLRERGMEAIGIDASLNMVERARGRRLEVHHGFFGAQSFDFAAESFGCVTCSNVFAHISDIFSVSREVHRLLQDGGLFLIEVHNADDLIPGHFDSIYHEHICYFTAGSLTIHLQLMGFEVIRTERTEMHGSGLRVTARKKIVTHDRHLQPGGRAGSAKRAATLISSTIQRFNGWIETVAAGREIHIYGAAGRAQMFLNMTSLGRFVQRAFDDAPIRQGKYLAGVGRLIEPFNADSGDICIITAWNYTRAILPRIRKNYREIYVALPEIERLS